MKEIGDILYKKKCMWEVRLPTLFICLYNEFVSESRTINKYFLYMCYIDENIKGILHEENRNR